MFNWKQMCENRAGYNGLHEELRCGRGRYILDEVKLPGSCGNRVCTVEFMYYGDDYIKLVCNEAPIDYSGSDIRIARWLESGTAEFNSFEQLDEFLARFGDPEPRRVRNEDPPETDRSSQTNRSTERERMRYDRESIVVPDPNKGYILIDKDKLAIDLNSEIFGQEDNVKKIAHLVKNFLGTKEKRTPLSIFIYGSPGIGKSALIELLADKLNEQLPRKDRFVFKPFDCSQIQHEEDISKLTGAAPGYIGYGDPGLFSVLEDNQNVIFMFDEIEKAAKNLTVTLMQAMENGRQATNGKTLSNGKDYYDLSHSIIFFTSNIVLNDNKRMGFGQNNSEEFSRNDMLNGNISRMISIETREAKNRMIEQGTFQKPVISRMNAIIRFNDLTPNVIADIAAKCIRQSAEARRLKITEIETRILQEFINETTQDVQSFDVRNFRAEAENFFGDAFLEYSLTHEDDSRIIVSGAIDTVEIIPDY